MKFFFPIFFILASFSDVISKGDLTRQKPITKIVNFNSIDGSSHMYEPNILEFETGFYINLFLKTKVNINIILPRIASQDQFLPERYKLTLKIKKSPK